ncbi:MAG: hypothetical protein RBS22_04225 [Spongiibacteraceae bacterium]|jgi:hypothetical protein|nr:hypothetical protein [Spongiibacteraceae bacterium]
MRQLRLPLLILLLALFGAGQIVEQAHSHQVGDADACVICHFSPALATAPALQLALATAAQSVFDNAPASAAPAARVLAFRSRAPPFLRS